MRAYNSLYLFRRISNLVFSQNVVLLQRSFCSTSDITNIRNVGIVAHIDAGKTTVSEQMLFVSGASSQVGRVDTGDTIMDFLPQERERGITISSAAISFKWKRNHINLIDTPGHVDFTIEVERSARVLDGAVIVIDAVAGVQAQTRTVWKQISKQNVPSIAFINKMDRDGANFNGALNSMKAKLGANVVPIQLPYIVDDEFCGAIDLISLSKLVWNNEGSSRNPLPPQVTAIASTDPFFAEYLTAKKLMLETLAELDEEFMQLFLDSENVEQINVSTVLEVIRKTCVGGQLIPVLCGAALKGKGVETLLNAVCAFLPSPLDRPPSKAVLCEKNVLTKSQSLEIKCDSTDLCALAFKIVNDRDRGPLVFIRTYSGELVAKQSIRNSTRNKKERVSQVLQISADDFQNLSKIGPGSVACLVGLKDTKTGDTLVLEKSRLHNYVLDGLSIPAPVFSQSIEPECSSKSKDLNHALSMISLEDPSLVVETDRESGQIILRGIGELHLEIVCDKIRRDYNVEITTGKTYVAFRESISPTQDNEWISKSITYNKTMGTKRMFASIDFQISSTGSTTEPTYILPPEIRSCLTADEYTSLIDGFQNAFIRGPLGYPVVGITVKVVNISKDSDTTPGAIRACCAMLVDSILRSADKLLLEPIMNTEIDVPTNFLGGVLSDLSTSRRAQVCDVLNQSQRSVILAEVPLSTMLGYATSIRSLTQGEGNFTMEYLNHRPIGDLSYINI